ncbi:MAG: hypothetical protein IJF65_08575 [Clostridia bacterium]|nr:hypothetical protein [Clostridia bacterium]
MAEDLFGLMQSLAPDLVEELSRRALVLERISALQPIGRRQLAAKLNLPEREVRAAASILREAGYISLDAAGMWVTEKATEILDSARAFSRFMAGLTEVEARLSAESNVPRVYVVPGDAEMQEQVVAELGRVTAAKIRGLLQTGNTLAVTGGSIVAQVAKQMPAGTPLNVMVVPARGGMGRSVEIQANTLAAEMAAKLGGHHRLMHIPDQMDPETLTQMLKVPEVKETMELIQRADVILHEISRGDDPEVTRHLPTSILRQLSAQKAVAESFGRFYDEAGNCLYSASSIGVDLSILQPRCQMIAVAAGKRKALAAITVLEQYPHAVLVADEGAAREMLSLYEKRSQS